MTKKQSVAAAPKSAPAEKPAAEALAEAAEPVEKPEPFILTESVDGLGPQGRQVRLLPSKAKDLPVRKLRKGEDALARQ
jgi:hypothetical protein